MQARHIVRKIETINRGARALYDGRPDAAVADVPMILLANLVVTLLMTGIIWFVQVVHYPLFAEVGRLAHYEALHATRTGWVVGPLMVAELSTAVELLVYRPQAASMPTAVLGVALVVVIWASTFALQVPLHDRLAQAPDAATVARLVATNWIRTVAWTLRAVLVVYWMAADRRIGS